MNQTTYDSYWNDPYAKLRPPPVTPSDELCNCSGQPAIKLMCALSYNPIHCIDCNGEVDPTTLSLTTDLVESIAEWRRISYAIELLWLDSGPYEVWAKAQLSDITSPVNVRGMRLRAQLEPVHHCHLWYFQDESDDGFTPITHCPQCGHIFTTYTQGIFGQYICEHCCIITVGN